MTRVGLIRNRIEVEWARDDRECDYLISDERIAGEPESWQGWELADAEDIIVLEGSAPDDLAEAVNKRTIYETRWPHEVEQTTVVDARVDYEVMTAYYSDEPPEDEAEPIGHREAEELLGNRGRNDVSMPALEDAWWFPRKDECGFVFEQEDSEGETYNTYRTVRNLSEDELALVEGEIQSLEEASEREMGLREKADRINENSRLYERQSQYVAAIIEGADGFTEIPDWGHRTGRDRATIDRPLTMSLGIVAMGRW